MNNIIGIHPDMKPMRDVKEFSDGDRLFYELGYKINHSSGYGNNWVLTGKFQEVENPLEWLKGDDRFQEDGFIEHHNFMLIKKK